MAKQETMRRKHVPQRMCTACRQKFDKRLLTRIVRTPELDIKIDASGKQNGRGAYLCPQAACWEKAITKDVLNHALRTKLTEADKEMLRDFRATLTIV
jgi:predicted RNA-binding protein YlxR (DUF448 family)